MKLAPGAAREAFDEADFLSVAETKSEDRDTELSFHTQQSLFLGPLASVATDLVTAVRQRVNPIENIAHKPGADHPADSRLIQSRHVTGDCHPPVLGVRSAADRTLAERLLVRRGSDIDEAEDSGVDDSDASCCNGNSHTVSSWQIAVGHS